MDFVFLRVATQPVDFFSRFNWADEQQVKSRLKNSPDFLLSVYLASPQLYASIEVYMNSEASDPALLRTLCKYVSRNSYRATPFGNFSAVGVAELSEQPEIRDIVFQLHTELGIHIRQKLFERLRPTPEELYVNTSLCQSGDHFHYFELINGEYHLSRIAADASIQRLLKMTKHRISPKKPGYRPYQELMAEMIKEQLLFSGLTPSVSDTSLKWLESLQNRVLPEFREPLNHLIQKLGLPHKNLADLQEIAGIVTPLVNEQGIFYANCSFDASACTVRKKEMEEIRSTLNELEALFVRREPPLLTDFKRKFYDQYGDAEIPLLQALDPVSGLTYGRAQEYGYEAFLNNRGSEAADTVPDLRLFPLQKALWSQAVRLNRPIVEADLSYLNAPVNIRYPDTQYALGELLEGGRFLLKNIGGASAYAIVARFGGLSSKLRLKCRHILEAEQPVADLVYLPPGPEGNVYLQEASGRCQMPYLTAGDARAPQLDIREVYVSVRDGREIVLRARGQVIQVRVPHAHNYHRGLPVYRFLGDLQFQGNTVNFTWNWGALADEPFLPRVVYKNIILCKATWNITHNQNLDELITGLPREVILVQGDNELYLDLRLGLCENILREELKKRGRLILKESLGEENTLVRKEGRVHYSEVVIPLKREAHTPRPSLSGGESGDWACFKLYAAPGVIDQVLMTRLPKLVRMLKRSHGLLRWFYVRYHDSGPHLRLRFLLKETTAGAVGEALRNVLKTEIADHRVYRIVPDRYFPETGRYRNMELAEEIFFRDSEHTLELVRLLPNPGRMGAAVQKIEAYLRAAGMNAHEQKRFCEKHRNTLLQEQPNPKQALKSMNLFFREQSLAEPPLRFPRKLYQAVKKRKPEEEVLASLIHMSLNRLFIRDQRALEMLAYHLLFRKLRIPPG